MAISPEVQAAAVRVAGDWAVQIAKHYKQWSGDVLKEQFTNSYGYILKTIEQRQ